jgi:hypothetical protein
MLTPKRLCEIESIVTAIRAAIGQGQHCTGGKELDAAGYRGEPGHKREGFEVIGPELRRPADACSFIIDSAKSKPKRSAFSTICKFRSNLGLYCGEVVQINQPLFRSE